MNNVALLGRCARLVTKRYCRTAPAFYSSSGARLSTGDRGMDGRSVINEYGSFEDDPFTDEDYAKMPPPKVHTIICAVVYISEGRDSALLDTLAEVINTAGEGEENVVGVDNKGDLGAKLITEFRDPMYHRTGFTIGGSPKGVQRAAIAASRHALGAIDLRLHKPNHPRLGVVDHVSVHPVGTSIVSMLRAESSAEIIAETLGEEGLPVLTYGKLKGGKRLAEVRRSTPYFTTGAVPDKVKADYGPHEVDPTKGIATVGCTPMVVNYNILLDTTKKSLAAAVTRAVREKDGGLPWVEALTLKREDGTYETACNLLRPTKTTTAMVLAKAEEQAKLSGVRIVKTYETGLDEKDAMQTICLTVMQ